MNKIPLIAVAVATLGLSTLPTFAASTSMPANDRPLTVASAEHRSLSRSVLDDSSTDSSTDSGSNSDQGNQSQSGDDSD